MFIEFNGSLLNTENVISFRKGCVDKNGKYPIYADHVVHDSAIGAEGKYVELCDSDENQRERFEDIKSQIISSCQME